MRTSLDAQAETRSGASERQTRAKSYGKEDVTYGDEIKAHAKTGCAGEVSVIGVLAIYICIHQPSIYAPVSSERILVYEPNDDVRSFSFLLHRSLLFIVLFFSARLAFSLASLLTFFSCYLLEIHQSRTYLRAYARTAHAMRRDTCRHYSKIRSPMHEPVIVVIVVHSLDSGPLLVASLFLKRASDWLSERQSGLTEARFFLRASPRLPPRSLQDEIAEPSCIITADSLEMR